jgi:hypothetical protein
MKLTTAITLLSLALPSSALLRAGPIPHALAAPVIDREDDEKDKEKKSREAPPKKGEAPAKRPIDPRRPDPRDPRDGRLPRDTKAPERDARIRPDVKPVDRDVRTRPDIKTIDPKAAVDDKRLRPKFSV